MRGCMMQARIKAFRGLSDDGPDQQAPLARSVLPMMATRIRLWLARLLDHLLLRGFFN